MTTSETTGEKKDALHIGRVFNEKFKVTSLIAKGGMGAVYRAEQAPLGRVCALKVLKPQLEEDARFEFQRRFFLEASIAAKLTHPNTVTIFDYGHTEDGLYFMAMEYLEGRTLHSAIRAEAPFDEIRTLHIAKQVCRALREAHAMGVIHRDIKPANIYLIEHADETDCVKVLDFGLVKDVEADVELTQAGLFMGSPKYMSPEQIRGEKIDARTDIYSLGIVLYEMLTGKPPFDKGASVNTLMAHINDPVPPLTAINPNVSPAMDELVMRCLAKNANDRFSSMEELLAGMKHTEGSPMSRTMELQAFSSSGPSGPVSISAGGALVMDPRQQSGTSTPFTLPPEAPPARSSSRAGVIGIALALIAAAAGAGFFLRPQPAPPPAASQPAAVVATTDTAKPTQAALPVAAPTPAPVASIQLHVTSDPNGASVHLDDKDGRELCEATPCDLKFAPGDDVQLVFVRKGFVTSTKKVPLVSGDVTEKLKTGGGGGRVVAPSGGQTPYRTDPYGANLPPY